MHDPWTGTALAVILLGCGCIGLFLGFLLAVLLLEPEAVEREVEQADAPGRWVVRSRPGKREGTS